MLIYCDSDILIYALDDEGAWHEKATKRLVNLWTAGDEVVVSDMVRLECRVGPIRDRDSFRLAVFDKFFASPDVKKARLNKGVYDRATRIRAVHGFKALDAINLAAAISTRCGKFLTNDHGLKNFPDITVELLT
jgi:predicted nucleic acid-binding protein